MHSEVCVVLHFILAYNFMLSIACAVVGVALGGFLLCCYTCVLFLGYVVCAWLCWVLHYLICLLCAALVRCSIVYATCSLLLALAVFNIYCLAVLLVLSCATRTCVLFLVYIVCIACISCAVSCSTFIINLSIRFILLNCAVQYVLRTCGSLILVYSCISICHCCAVTIIYTSLFCMLEAYFIACYSLLACGWLCSLSVRHQVFTEASGIYVCGGYFAPGWFCFQWHSSWVDSTVAVFGDVLAGFACSF